MNPMVHQDEACPLKVSNTNFIDASSFSISLKLCLTICVTSTPMIELFIQVRGLRNSRIGQDRGRLHRGQSRSVS